LRRPQCSLAGRDEGVARRSVPSKLHRGDWENTDDHLRNHGFLLTPAGWRLSPAFDLNADPDGQGLSLNITETDNSLDFEVAREVSEYFRLEPRDADRVLGEAKQAVARWRETASELGIGRSEQESMEVAFRH
jgi:serine/threonine-protein kinase HipA